MIDLEFNKMFLIKLFFSKRFSLRIKKVTTKKAKKKRGGVDSLN